MMRPFQSLNLRSLTPLKWPFQVVTQRPITHQAFDAGFDQDQLAEARKWRQSFQVDSLPEGSTSYSRSSGPGGQHVNKTESKATTVWPVSQLLSHIPKLLHAGIRESKYYSKRNDHITIQAQTQRSRTANTDENRHKLFEEIQDLYQRTVPNETSQDKKRKHEALRKSANEARIKEKKYQSSKKASRRGSSD
ncbi:hypothetical protein QBC44DRAFT_264056 [Cladorrhinum sp. PSN332]|nr:hypothetical protein QBC44DRAFT_264056 [Cladorrhinum sp. PSN332]